MQRESLIIGLLVFASTARAETLIEASPTTRENNADCGWVTITSTAPAAAVAPTAATVWEPAKGGLLTTAPSDR